MRGLRVWQKIDACAEGSSIHGETFLSQRKLNVIRKDSDASALPVALD